MNKCQSCGTLVPEDQAFCFNCGGSMLPEEKNKRSGSFLDMQSTMLPPEDFNPQMPLRPRTEAVTPAPPVQPAPPPVVKNEPAVTTEPEPPANRNAPSVKAYNASNVAPVATPGGKSNTGFYIALGAGFALMFFFLLLLIGVLYFFFFSN